jgi:hypothetical protein
LYIRKIGVVLAVLGGFQLGARHQRKEYNLMLLRNYHRFDSCFKDALETGDARYLRWVDEVEKGEDVEGVLW